MMFWVGICRVTGLQSMRAVGLRVLFCEHRISGVRAALPTLSLKQVLAERAVVTMRKERINFMVRFPLVWLRAPFLFASRLV